MVFTAAVTLSYIFHFFLGMAWRFSKVRIVSGENVKRSGDQINDDAKWTKFLNEKGYQINGGLYMKYFLYMEGISLSLLITLIFGGCIWLYCFKRGKEQ